MLQRITDTMLNNNSYFSATLVARHTLTSFFQISPVRMFCRQETLFWKFFHAKLSRNLLILRWRVVPPFRYYLPRKFEKRAKRKSIMSQAIIFLVWFSNNSVLHARCAEETKTYKLASTLWKNIFVKI